MKKIFIEDITIFYQEFGAGTNTMLLLHGWGQSHAFWESFIKKNSKKYHIYVLDLPGFGLSQEPPKTWTVHDYALFVHEFVSTLHISTPILIGHSFGGRIASVYASLFPLKKLVLYSNGELPSQSFRRKLNKYIIVYFGRFIFPKSIYQLHTIIFKPKHYQNNVIVTRQKAKRMLDIYVQPFYDVTKHLQKIKTQTLIITGSKDYIVSPSNGKRMHQLIQNYQLVEIADATHFAHLESPKVFDKTLEKFLKNESAL